MFMPTRVYRTPPKPTTVCIHPIGGYRVVAEGSGPPVTTLDLPPGKSQVVTCFLRNNCTDLPQKAFGLKSNCFLREVRMALCEIR